MINYFSNLNWIAVLTHIVVTCSILHAILPPWEMFADFPRAQKLYKLFVYLVGYVALNWRSTLWKSLSTEDGTKISNAVINGGLNGKATQTPGNAAVTPTPTDGGVHEPPSSGVGK